MEVNGYTWVNQPHNRIKIKIEYKIDNENQFKNKCIIY